jgi:hypothetical protein
MSVIVPIAELHEEVLSYVQTIEKALMRTYYILAEKEFYFSQGGEIVDLGILNAFKPAKVDSSSSDSSSSDSSSGDSSSGDSSSGDSSSGDSSEDDDHVESGKPVQKPGIKKKESSSDKKVAKRAAWSLGVVTAEEFKRLGKSGRKQMRKVARKKHTYI